MIINDSEVFNGLPIVKKQWIKVEVDGKKRYMLISESMYKKILDSALVSSNSKKS